jgi:hypothetical protein
MCQTEFQLKFEDVANLPTNFIAVSVLEELRASNVGEMKLERIQNNNNNNNTITMNTETSTGVEQKRDYISSFIVQAKSKPFPIDVKGYEFHLRDLNDKNRGKFVYVGYKRSKTDPPVTSLDFKAFDTAQFSPPQDWLWFPTDINLGSGGKFIYLCYKCGEENKPPITDIDFSGPLWENTPPSKPGWTLIPQDLCQGCTTLFRTSPFHWAYYKTG